jgi:hypothetical protein
MKYVWIALLAGTIALVTRTELTRPGYTADEEFTEFAVRGIAATGLPLLPSGLLYDRGLAYSYAAWLARTVAGEGLAPARALSLVTALSALVALWIAVSRASSALAAWLAVLLVAASIPFWVVATTARFYAPFLAVYLATLATIAGLARHRFQVSPATAVVLVVTAALCRWTHELAFTLAAVPICGLLFDDPRHRRKWISTTLAIVAGLVIAQAAIVALHMLAPQSGTTMIRRFFLWQVLNLFERPPLAAPLGALLLLGVVAIIVAPGVLSRRFAASAIGRAFLVMTAGVLAWGTATGFDRAFDYALDLFWHIARTTPLLPLSALALLGARAAGLGGPWRPTERAVHLLWIGWVAFFGIIDSGVTINYLLVPVTLMLAAVGVDLGALLRTHDAPGRRGVAMAVTALVVGAIALDTWGTSPRARLVAARPTIEVPDTARIDRLVRDAEMVACTDELACLLLVGRVDRWLALDPFLRERFIVSRDGRNVGVYAGVPAIDRLTDLFAPASPPPARVLIVDVFKDLPVGSSSAFLPRQLAAERFVGETKLETAQLRVIELVINSPF